MTYSKTEIFLNYSKNIGVQMTFIYDNDMEYYTDENDIEKVAYEILRLIRKLNEDFGITIVMVLHNINQALTYSDEIVGLKDGHICVKGMPNKVINAEIIKEIYDIELEVFERDGKLCVMTV